MSVPFQVTRPVVGLVIVARMRMRVDFPAPLGPSRPSTPGPSARVISRRPQTAGVYCLPTRSMVRVKDAAIDCPSVVGCGDVGSAHTSVVSAASVVIVVIASSAFHMLVRGVLARQWLPGAGRLHNLENRSNGWLGIRLFVHQ